MKVSNRKDIRKDFKDAGYRVSFNRNPFNQELVSLSFTPIDNPFPKPISFSGVFTSDFRLKHLEAFELYTLYSGVWLECTEQKIV